MSYAADCSDPTRNAGFRFWTRHKFFLPEREELNLPPLPDPELLKKIAAVVGEYGE